MKKILLTISSILALSFWGCENQASNQGISTTDSTVTKPEIKPNWTYSQDSDKMTDNIKYYAECISTNKIEFAFPYEGGSSFTLLIRHGSEGNEALLGVSKGQFTSQSIRVKFDDQKPLTFEYTTPSDGSTDWIFLNNPALFLQKLKAAKKLLIEATFFDAGSKHIEFNVDGFKWDK